MGKTEDILHILREELKNGHYKAGGKFPSERKLMMRFDVARPTVNRITTQLAAEGLLERGVQGSGTRVVEYSPFPAGHLAYLGLISHPYYARMLGGIQEAAYLKNFAVSFFAPKHEQACNYLEKICRSNYQGLLATNIGILPENFPIPVVYLDNGYTQTPGNSISICCTSYKGAVDMAEAVIAHGHREILICSNYSDLETSRQERIRGLRETLEKYGVADIEKRIFHEPIWDFATARTLIKKMLKEFPETTVIVSDTDNIAARLQQAVIDLKLPYPLTVTGFGNLAFSDSSLRFPTVEQHPEVIGAQGVNELFHMLRDKDYKPEGRIEIETELVSMESLPHLK